MEVEATERSAPSSINVVAPGICLKASKIRSTHLSSRSLAGITTKSLVSNQRKPDSQTLPPHNLNPPFEQLSGVVLLPYLPGFTDWLVVMSLLAFPSLLPLRPLILAEPQNTKVGAGSLLQCLHQRLDPDVCQSDERDIELDQLTSRPHLQHLGKPDKAGRF